MTKKTEVKKKRPYQKPQIEQILLKPDEAALGACKTSGSNGYNGECMAGPSMGCVTIGS